MANVQKIVLLLVFSFIPTLFCVPGTLPVGPSSDPDPRLFKKFNDEREASPDQCHRAAKLCHKVENITCLGTKLPYDHISFEFTGLNYTWEVKSELSKWKRLQAIPKCWSVIQPLVCSIFMAKCTQDEDTGEKRLELISQQLCSIVQGPCRIVQQFKGLQKYLECNNSKIYSKSCKDRRRGPLGYGLFPKFNSSQGHCIKPLVSTEREDSYYHDFDGCGMGCQSSVYHFDPKISIPLDFIFIAGGLLLALVVLTYLIAGRNGKLRFSSKVMFNMSVCWMGIMWTFLMQTFMSKEKITCQTDGTRVEEGYRSHTTCTVFAFFLIHFFFSLLLWFLALNFFWYIEAMDCVEESGERRKLRKKLESKSVLIHMTLWTVPFVLAALLTISDGWVEADSFMGVCFISSKTPMKRIAAFIAPLSVTLIVSLAFNIMSLVQLKDHLPFDNKILVKRGFFCLVNYFAILITIASDAYKLSHATQWDMSIRDFILCSTLKKSDDSLLQCQVKDKPPPFIIYANLICLISAGLSVVYAWWCLALNVVSVCKGALDKIRGQVEKHDSQSKPKGKKHKIIEEAYNNRLKLQQDGRLSISLSSLDNYNRDKTLDPETSESEELHTSFLEALPRLVNRRNALHTLDLSSQYDESEMQIPLSRRNSNRHSFGSQMSIQTNELEDLQNFHNNEKAKKRSKRNFFGRNKPKRRLRRRLSISRLSNNSFNQARDNVDFSLSLSSASSVSQISSFFKGANNFEMRRFKKQDTNLTNASVQTEITDLTESKTTKQFKSVGTQWDEELTESRPLRHLEPNVIRISVPSQDKSSEDSLMSSFDRDVHLSTAPILPSSSKYRQKENKDLPRANCREFHNRARRGGVIADDINSLLHNPLQTSSTS